VCKTHLLVQHCMYQLILVLGFLVAVGMEFWAVQVMPAFVPSLLCYFYLQSYDSRPQDGIVPVNKVLMFIYQAFCWAPISC